MTQKLAYIFDLDGVITDTAHLHFVAWQALAHSQGIAFDEVFNERLKGVSRMDSLDVILAQSSRSYSAAEKAELADAKNTHYVQLLEQLSPADLLPGALAALQAVRREGYALGLASASKNAAAVLGKLGITALFDHVVDSNFVPHGKPAPDIFLMAAAALGCTPKDCVGVEDSVAGVQAIKSAGMFALGVGQPQVLHLADTVVPNLLGFEPRYHATGI